MEKIPANQFTVECPQGGQTKTKTAQLSDLFQRVEEVKPKDGDAMLFQGVDERGNQYGKVRGVDLGKIESSPRCGL